MTRVLRCGLIQLPFYFAGIALVQWYAATGAFRPLLAITGSAIVIKFALNAYCAAARRSGIMVSSAGMYVVTVSLMWLLMANTAPQRGQKP